MSSRLLAGLILLACAATGCGASVSGNATPTPLVYSALRIYRSARSLSRI